MVGEFLAVRDDADDRRGRSDAGRGRLFVRDRAQVVGVVTGDGAGRLGQTAADDAAGSHAVHAPRRLGAPARPPGGVPGRAVDVRLHPHAAGRRAQHRQRGRRV